MQPADRRPDQPERRRQCPNRTDQHRRARAEHLAQEAADHRAGQHRRPADHPQAGGHPAQRLIRDRRLDQTPLVDLEDDGWRVRKLLPNTKVVTISQVVQTQVGVNRLMSNTSLFVLVVLVVVGGASLAGAIAANVRERRREIGTLMALGATPGLRSRAAV